MDYDLIRVDYALCGVTLPGTLKILPGTKNQQKFAIGDKNGVLQCLSIKDEEPTVLFKTLPGKAITSVQLATGPGNQGDKIFAASGNEVKGYTRKGKLFLTLETTLSETITSMSIQGGDLVLGSGRVVTHFRDLREQHSYACEDRILDLVAFAIPNNTRIRLLVSIANKGVILLEGGQVAAKLSISAGPTRLLVPPAQHSIDIHAVYGAADGSIGCITYNSVELLASGLMEGKGLGPVVCAGWWKNSSSTHLVVGRHDGSVQLYLIDTENLQEKPRLKFTYFCGEPVTSVSGGCVGTDEGEIVATTFSGRIFALRQRRFATAPSLLSNMPQDVLTARRNKLEAEIVRLEKQTAGEREKYQRNTRATHGGVSAPPLLDIHCQLAGASRDGWQEITVTSAVPLDMLFLYCNTKLDLHTDSAAVLSICPSQNNMNDLLATVRCQAGTRRLWIRVRISRTSPLPLTIDVTTLQLYSLPAGAPRVARHLTMKLPTLPFYSQHADVNKLETENRPWCEMKISGGFSVAEMTSWLSLAFSGDLPKPGQSITFARVHTLLETVVIAKYQRGSAIFNSDNVSTITALKDHISNCSLQKTIRLDIYCDIPDNYCYDVFAKIEKKFHLEYNLSQDLKLLKAMLALDLDTNNANEISSQLCEDYLRVWLSRSNEAVNYFDDLIGTIEQWYKDWRVLSLRGTESSNKLASLHKALINNNVQDIKDILKYNSQLSRYADDSTIVDKYLSSANAKADNAYYYVLNTLDPVPLLK